MLAAYHMPRQDETSDLNLKFVTPIRQARTNFRFVRVTGKCMILAWFKDLKLL